MNKQEKAKIILEAMEEYLQIDWNFEKYYIRGIVEGLIEIEKREAACGMKLEIVDKATGKIVWVEQFDNLDSLESAKQTLKANNFNPDFFNYVVKRGGDAE
jgi:hypothetical protein